MTASRVLELAKNAKALFDRRSPREKLDLLRRVVCNPRLDGRTARYDLRKPFDTLAKMAESGEWRPQRDTQVSALVRPYEFAPVSEVWPTWLGGMTQEEAGLTLTLVARA